MHGINIRNRNGLGIGGGTEEEYGSSRKTGGSRRRRRRRRRRKSLGWEKDWWSPDIATENVLRERDR